MSQLNRALLAGIAVLLVCIVTGTFVHQQRARSLYGAALESARQAAGAAAQGRDQVNQNLAVVQALADLERRPTVGMLLAELGARLPRDVWIEELSFEGDHARLRGYAPAGFDVAASLKNSAVIDKSELQSSASAGLGTVQDRFEIALSLRSGASQ